MEITKQQLVSLLEEAQNAHHEYEKSIEGTDDEWAEWYAQYIQEHIE